MYGSIRQYKVDSSVVIRILQQFQQELIPIIRAMPEYKAFYVITKGTESMVTVAIFDSREGANRADLEVQGMLQGMGALVLTLPGDLSGEVTIRIER